MVSPLHNIPIKVENTPAPKRTKGTDPLDEARKKVYPRRVRGRFDNWRILFVIVTQAVFLGLPWLTWNSRQAVYFDLVDRKFYLFELTIFPQDLIYLCALLLSAAFGLFVWTTIAGRLWCGYSCPQTVYTEIMLWIEAWLEGDRAKRIKLDQQPMHWTKLRIKLTKHLLMIAFSLWTGFTLVGYFTPIRELAKQTVQLDYGPWEAFWVFFYAGFTYLLAGFLREQVCKYMCPYARFQSVMFDADTLIISYDEKRGEPRGARKKGDDPKTLGLGDCVNCHICVQVCPVGIDIRNGLQYECIGCAACIDACDDVMDKLGYPRGLIRYTTENALEGQYNEKRIWSRLWRPRVLLYSLVLVAVLATSITGLVLRKPFRVDVMRDRAMLVRETDDGWLENSYSLKIINVSEQDQRFRITVRGLPDIRLQSDTQTITVSATQSQTIGVRVQAEPQYATKGSHKIYFVVTSLDKPALSVEEPSSFIGE